MNSGPLPPKDSGEPFSWKLRPTLGIQLKIKTNSSIPPKDSGQPFSRPTPFPQKIQVNPSAEN